VGFAFAESSLYTVIVDPGSYGMNSKANKLRIYFFAGWVVVVLSVVLCGCASREDQEADAYYKKGVACKRSKKYASAISAYKQAVALNPNHAKAYHDMGMTYGDLKRYAESITAYRKGLALNPDDAYAYFGMGMAYNKLGKHADALASYKKFIAMEPSGMQTVLAQSQINELSQKLSKRR
jgi:tetratricopeptide (TPR) repeat protein